MATGGPILGGQSSDEDEEPAGQSAPWADVGLVVVHGIGEQARGATLLDWAEPITRRLDELASGVDVVRSQIVDADRSEVRLLVRLDEGRECRMTITEARWADAFLTVSSSDVLAWGRRFSSRALRRLLAHARRTVRMVSTRGSARTDQLATLIELIERRFGTWLPLIGGTRTLSILVRLVGLLLVALVLVGGLGLAAVFGPLAAVLITVVTLLLAALAKVPVLGKRLHAVLAGLVLTVGDATSWTERPLRAAAMRDRVRDAIVGADADHVVVLGHSQGAAVAAEAVLGPGAPEDGRVAMLVTVGGAVSLLRRPRWSTGSQDAVPGAVARWSARPELGWANLWATWDPVSSGPVTDRDEDATVRWRELYVAGLGRIEAQTEEAAAKLATFDAATATLAETFGTEPVQPAEPEPAIRPTTMDLWRRESHDLATLGRGERAELSVHPSVAGPAEWAVHNRASILADHTTYTSNVRQVIEPLARLLVEIGGQGTALPPRNLDAAKAHVNAVRMLGALRLSALATSVVGLAVITSRGIELPIIDWLVRAVRPLSAGTADGLSWLGEQSWQGYVQFAVAGAIIAAVLVAVGSALWNRWHRALSWSGSRGAVVPGAAFFAYYALTVLTPIGLVAMQLDHVVGWWVWLLAVAIGVAVIIWPLVGPRPQPLIGRRLTPAVPAADRAVAGPAGPA